MTGGSGPEAAAARVDRETGAREEFAFLTHRGAAMFAVTYLPAGPPRAGLVVCSPILVEHLTNYRHEVLLARALAEQGVAVQRFHYRGAGHSLGDESAMALDTMVDDAVAAAAHLLARTAVPRLAFLGTRWGALVAARAASAHAGAPLVLWEPVVAPGRYFRELIRGRLVREAQDARFAAGTGAWAEELAREGRIDIMGYALHKRLVESGQEAGLGDLLSDPHRPVLLVQIARLASLRPDYAALRDELERRGGRPDVRLVRAEPAWLFPAHQMESAEVLLRLSTEWLLSMLNGAQPR